MVMIACEAVLCQLLIERWEVLVTHLDGGHGEVVLAVVSVGLDRLVRPPLGVRTHNRRLFALVHRDLVLRPDLVELTTTVDGFERRLDVVEAGKGVERVWQRVRLDEGRRKRSHETAVTKFRGSVCAARDGGDELLTVRAC